MPVTNLLKPETKTWLDKSVQSELFAHFLYSQIANELQRLGFFGAEKYFRNESDDEYKHYHILVNYYNDLGSVAKIPVLPTIEVAIMNIGDALNKAYQTELDLMRQYEDFYNEVEENDPVTSQFLLQFLLIQKNSVGDFMDFISRYEKCGNNEAAILDFDEMMEDNKKV